MLGGVPPRARIVAMQDAIFWRERRSEFDDLARAEYEHVPDPADDRRLGATGVPSDSPRDGIGDWTLNQGCTAEFRRSFEQTAAFAATGLDPPPNVPLVAYWIDWLFRHLLAIDPSTPERGHLAVADERFAGIRDLCTASAEYCSWLATQSLEISVVRRLHPSHEIDPVRIRARQMLAEGATHQEVCQRLKDQPRPPRAEWRHLEWDKAYMDPRFRAAVCKWLSRNCRP